MIEIILVILIIFFTGCVVGVLAEYNTPAYTGLFFIFFLAVSLLFIGTQIANAHTTALSATVPITTENMDSVEWNMGSIITKVIVL